MMPWNELFGSESTSSDIEYLDMRLLRKHRRPLLLVPCQPHLAAQCLDLYAAQTGGARAVKAILRRLWRLGVLAKTEKTSLLLPRRDGFTAYLNKTANSTGPLPQFGILAGNPAGGTQRFIILLFDANNQPAAAVKAGVSQGARELIQKERIFLQSVPVEVKGIPRIESKFSSDSLEAFAMRFYTGESPGSSDTAALPILLTSWIHPARTVSLQEFPEIAVAMKAFAGTDQAAALDRKIHTALQHGDFAPWNIKVSPDGSCRVLDWERGRLAGIPAWDWFHYEIQTGILVHKTCTRDLVRHIDRLLASAPFRAYAEKARILGIEVLLLRAYLLHLIEVIKPAEGLEQNRALLEALKGASAPTGGRD